MESSRLLTTSSRGFTLVEMLVVLAIIAIVTTIALLGQGTFNRSVFLTDTAYSMALSIREMQTLGLSSRAFGGVQNAGYGAYFTSATPSTYLLYADTDRSISVPSNCLVGESGTPEAKPGDCVYTPGADGIVQTYTLGRGFRVSQICGTLLSGTRKCSTDGASPLTALSITFLRSSTDTMAEGYQGGVWNPLTKAEIYIQSPDGVGTRGICISQVGQVSVANETCP